MSNENIDTSNYLDKQGKPTKRLYLSIFGFIFGFIAIALIGIGLIVIAIIPVIASGFELSTLAGVATLILIGLLVVAYFRLLKLGADNAIDFIQAYFNLQILIILLAFLQIIFWMLQPTNPVHAPRVTFMLTLSAVMAYMKAQFKEKIALSKKTASVAGADPDATLPS